jgi:hypothetical protein
MSKKTKMWAGIAAAVVVFAIIGALNPPDRDGDGIPDDDDSCPAVAGIAPTGCPDEPEIDSDRDGVLDDDDACPAVPGPAPSGCPQQQPEQTLNLTGRWREDRTGVIYDVRHTGNTFVGNAFVPGTGPVTFSGTINGRAATIQVIAGGMQILASSGSVGPGSGGIDVTFQGAMFHVNH